MQLSIAQQASGEQDARAEKVILIMKLSQLGFAIILLELALLTAALPVENVRKTAQMSSLEVRMHDHTHAPLHKTNKRTRKRTACQLWAARSYRNLFYTVQ